jgi:hypothetical protein
VCGTGQLIARLLKRKPHNFKASLQKHMLLCDIVRMEPGLHPGLSQLFKILKRQSTFAAAAGMDHWECQWYTIRSCSCDLLLIVKKP